MFLSFIIGVSSWKEVVRIPFEISIVGDIIDLTAMKVGLGLLKAHGSTVQIRIESDGGFTKPGFSIVDRIQSYKGQTEAIVPRKAHSMASAIALCCDKVYMWPGAKMLVHRPHINGAEREAFTGESNLTLGLDELRVMGIYYSRLKRDSDHDYVISAVNTGTALSARDVANLFNNVYVI